MGVFSDLVIHWHMVNRDESILLAVDKSGSDPFESPMRENIPAHVLRQIKEEIKNA